MQILWQRTLQYQPVEEEKLEEDLSICTNVRQYDARIRIACALPNIISFLVGVVFAALMFFSSNAFLPSSTYSTGFSTEINALRPSIAIVAKKFSGTLRYKGEHLYISQDPSEPRYFGTPTKEVDDAWEDLIGNHEGAFIEDILVPDVLHTLHCLNEVRKVLDSQHYYNSTLESLNRGRRIHIDHCLNHIRQVIQCHMDLTPVRTIYFPEMNTEVGDFDQVHTCRDFSKLKEYLNENFVRKSKVPQVSADGRIHRLGYPNTEESFLAWNSMEHEFE